MKTCVNPITRTNLISTVAHNLEYSMGYIIVLHKKIQFYHLTVADPNLRFTSHGDNLH